MRPKTRCWKARSLRQAALASAVFGVASGHTASDVTTMRIRMNFRNLRRSPILKVCTRSRTLRTSCGSVMNHSMQAKGDAPTLQRVSKWGIVFEDFYSEGIHPEDCITVLKDRGGMDYIYEQISASKNAGRQEHSDVAYHTSCAPSVHTNPGTPNPFAAHDDASVPAESSASGDAVARSIAMHAVPQADGEVQELSARSTQKDHGQHSPVSEAVIASRYDKKGRLNRIDLGTEVAMQLSPDDLEAILNSAAGLIRYNVIRRDGRGWVHIAASIKQIIAHGELQPEGTPRSESDRDADLRAVLSDESDTEAAASEPTRHGAPAFDSGRPIAKETASLTVAANEDRATSSPRRIDENSTNGFTSPKADRVLIAPAGIAAASGAFSVPKVETIRGSTSGTTSRKHADTIRTNTPVSKWPLKLEELPDLSVPQPVLSSKPKPRRRR